MKRLKPFLVTITALILLTSSTSWAQGTSSAGAIEEAERTALMPSRSMIEEGRDVVQLSCAGCHGMDGLSDADGKPHLAGQRAVYLYRVMRAYQNGSRGGETNEHKRFLDDAALLSAAAYYASLTPARATAVAEPLEPMESVEPPETADQQQQAPVVEGPEDDPFLGIRTAMKKCVKCHDETGNSSGSGMPNLTGQDPEYFVKSMQAYVDGSRSHKLMGRLVGKLDEATIKEMGVFYAVQQPMRSETQGEGDAKNGRRLAADCEICHGADGNALSGDMPTLAGQDARYFLKAMNAYKSGKRQDEDMVEVVEEFNETDFKDMATYYAEQLPIQRDVRTPLNSKQWIRRCVRCHGIDGNSTDPRFPMLAGQDATYLNRAIRAYALGVRPDTAMRAMAEPLNKVDIEYIASYFSSRQPKSVVYIPLPCGE